MTKPTIETIGVERRDASLALSDFDGTTIDRSGDRFLFTPRLQTFVGLQ